jgi:hypothetical protein
VAVFALVYWTMWWHSPWLPFLQRVPQEWGRTAFDSARWRAAPPVSFNNLRGEMVADLLHSGVLVGQSHEQVVELLGKPDQVRTTWNDQGSAPTPEAVRHARYFDYGVGIHSGADILVLIFGREGRVQSYGLTQG